MPAIPDRTKVPPPPRVPRDDEPAERDVAEEETDKQGPEAERGLDEPVTRFPAG
jgi:hypothetical protein